jgi:hypothetical protein
VKSDWSLVFVTSFGQQSADSFTKVLLYFGGANVLQGRV